MIRRPPRSTLDRSSAASDVYKRQVEALDTALRRRFSFVPMAPEPEELKKQAGQVNLQTLLRTLNNRLIILKDADHTIGHALLWEVDSCLLYTSPSPRDRTRYRMPSSA